MRHGNELCRGGDPLLGFRRQVAEEVCLPSRQLRQRGLVVAPGEPPDDAPNPRSAEDMGRVAGQVDRLAGGPVDEPIRSRPNRCTTERMRRQSAARYGIEQVPRDDPHVVDRIEQLLRIRPSEAECYRVCVTRRDRADLREPGPCRGADEGVTVHLVGEDDVRSGNGCAVVPSHIVAELEGERDRIFEGPRRCEPRHERGRGDQVEVVADVRQPKEHQVDHRAPDVGFGNGWQQRPCLCRTRDDDGPAPRTETSLVGRAAGQDTGQRQQQEGMPHALSDARSNLRRRSGRSPRPTAPAGVRSIAPSSAHGLPR